MTEAKRLSFFEKYLTLWVMLCIGAGIGMGETMPELAFKLNSLSIYRVSMPIAICLFFMMYPIMVKIDFAEVLKVAKNSQTGRAYTFYQLGNQTVYYVFHCLVFPGLSF